MVPATAEEAAAGMLMCCGRLGGWVSPPSTGVGAKGGIGSGLRGRPSPTGMGGLGGRLLWSASTGVCGTGAWLLWLALAALDSRGRDRRLAYCCRCRPALKGVGGTCSGALLPALAAPSALDEARAAGPRLLWTCPGCCPGRSWLGRTENLPMTLIKFLNQRFLRF